MILTNVRFKASKGFDFVVVNSSFLVAPIVCEGFVLASNSVVKFVVFFYM